MAYELCQSALYDNGFEIGKRKGENSIIDYCGMNCINLSNMLFYMVMVPYIVFYMLI